MKRILGVLFLVVAAMVAFAGPAAAAPPANDDLADATVITGRAGSVAGSNAEGTGEVDEVVYSDPTESVWYSWTPTRDGWATFHTCTSSFDTTLGLFTGTTFPLTNHDFDDDTCSSPNSAGSWIQFEAVAGQRYLLQVDGFGSNSGTFTLEWYQDVLAPANDDLDMAGGLHSDGGTRLNHNFDATKEEGEADHAGDAGGSSVWYSWTAPRAGAATFEVGATFDTLLAVYTQGGTGHVDLVLAGENDDRSADVTSSAVTFTASAGQTYLVAVDGKAAVQGDFTLTWGLPPANDALADATDIDPAGETLYATNRYGGAEAGEPQHAGVAGGRSVWFSWTAPYDGWTEINTGGSDFDTLLGIYESSAPGTAGLEPIGSNDDATEGTTASDVRFFANGGTTYLVAVDGKAGATGNIRLSVGQAPAEDLMAQAEVLEGPSGTTPAYASYWSTLATAEAGEPAHAGQTAAKSLWFRWQATDDGRAVFSTAGTPFDTVTAVYTQPGSTITDLIRVVENDDVGTGDTTSSVSFITSAGTTYYVAVDGKAGASGPISIQWRSGPVNDERAYATGLSGDTGSTSGSTINAAASPGDPQVAPYGDSYNVWYRWTAPSSGAAQFALSNWSNYYSPSLRAFVEQPDGSFLEAPKLELVWGWYGHPTVRFAAEKDVTYLIGAASSWDNGTFDLSWQRLAPPANDAFASAITWDTDSGSGDWTNHWATKEPGEPAHAEAAGGSSVWYRWTPTISGTARIGFDSWYVDGVAAVYTGDSVDSLTQVASNDDRPGSSYPFLRFPVVAGTTYRVAVDTKNAGHTTGTHNWTVVPTPTNDLLSGATVLAATGGKLTGQDTAGAFTEPGEPAHAGRTGGASLWYRFTAPAEGGTLRLTAKACDGCWYPDLFANAYTSDGSSVDTLTSVASSDNAGPGLYYPRLLLRTVPGTTYYVAVDAPNGEAHGFEVAWDLVPTPANDHFETPLVLTGASGLVDGDNAGATRQAGEPNIVPDRDGQQSVWYSWTAPSDGTATFETAGSAFDTLLGVFTGDELATIQHVASNWYRDTHGNGASRVITPVTAGTTYRIGLAGNSIANGALTLQWTLEQPPVNDDFAEATLLEGTSGTITGTNIGATKEAGEQTHYTVGGASTWYKFVAPSTGQATFTTVGSDNDTAMVLYTGTRVDQLWGRVGDHDSGGDLAARIQFQMSEGETYHLAVDTRDAHVGDIVVNYAFRARAANDAFETPQALEGVAGSVSGSTIGATTQSGEPCCDGSSVWYTWTAPANGEVRFTTTSPGFGGVNAVKAFTGTQRDALTEVSPYAENSWYGGSSVMRFPVTEGTTYRVAVYSYYYYGGQQYDFVLNYNIGPPEHDGFAAPRVLYGTNVTDTSVNLGATAEAGEPQHAGDAATSSVWFQWTAPATGSATVDLAGSTFDSQVAVYTGSALDALTAVVANDDSAEGTTTSAVTFDAVKDTVYRIAVDGKGAAQGGVRLSLIERVPELSINDMRVDEAAGNAVFTVTRGGALQLPATVEYSTYDGSAGAADYSATSSNGTPLTFAAGETSKTIAVPVTSDAIDEEDEEHFGVLLHAVVGGVIVDGTGLGTIVDDDLPPTLTWTGAEVTEGGAGTTVPLTFTATLSGPSGRAISIAASTANGSAFSPSDYVARTETLHFAAGETVKAFAITVNGDTTDEDDQTFTAALASPVNVTLPLLTSATGTILDDDPPPDVNISDAPTVTEVAGGVNATFTVTLSARSEKTVQVGFATADGMALVSRGDYTARTGTLSFAPGETTKTLTVNVLDDVYDEFDQQFTMQLSEASNGTIVDGSGTATIIDEDATPLASIADGSATEGGDVSFVVTTSAPSEKPISIPFVTAAADPVTEPATTDTGALGGADHPATTGSLAFAQDEVSKTVLIATNADVLHEYDETFGVVLGTPTNVEYADAHANGTIVNDDAAPALAVQDAAFVEADSLTTSHPVAVTLSAPSGRRISVAYTVAGGSATSTADYAPVSGTLQFAPGDQSESVAFGVVGDLTDEFDQTALLALSSPVDATIGRSPATLTITDDDQPPVITLADAAAVTEVAGGVDAVFAATLERASEKTVSVDWATVDGTALVGRGDYTAGSGTLTFAAGDIAETVTVRVLDDGYDEFDQQLSVVLDEAVDGTIGDGTATVTIRDEDAEPLASIADASAVEGESLSFAVTTSAPSEKPITIPFITGGAQPATEPATTDAGAVGGADFPFTSGSVSFAQDEMAKTITVVTNADDLHEYDETMGVVFGDPLNVGYADGRANGSILNDDAAPSISVADAAFTEGDAGSTDHAVEVGLSAISGRRISVVFDLAAGTATAVDDFTTRTGTLTFAPGEQAKTVTFTVAGDTVDEHDQTAVLTLSAPVDVTLDRTATTLTVTDDDLPPVASFTTAALRLDEPAGPANLTVALDQRSEKTVTVPVALADESTSAADHGAGPAPLVFTPGTTSLGFGVGIVNDTTDEPEQAFRLTLQEGTDVRISASTGSVRTVTIVDDDLPPFASIPNETTRVAEAIGSASATVHLSEVSEWPITLTLATQDFTTSPADHGDPTPNPVSFAIGTTEQTVSLPIVDDATDEPDQNVQLFLLSGTNVRIEEAPFADVVFTIVDDDEPPTVGITGAATVDEAQATIAYQLGLSAVSEKDVTVTYVLEDVTTSAGDHGHLAPASPLVIPAGSTGAAVSLPITDDDLDETDEQLRITITGATNASPAGEPVSTTIVDDDATPVATDVGATTDEDIAVPVALVATDADSTSLTYGVATGPARGAVVIDGATATYTPAADANGVDSFTYTASDGTNTSGPRTVTVTIVPVNDVPTAQASSATVAEDTQLTLDLAPLVGDVETADADLVITAVPSHGSALVEGRTLRYQGPDHLHGPVTVTYTVIDRGDPDGCGTAGPSCSAPRSASAELAVTITPVNDVPTATDTTVTLDEDAVAVPVDLRLLVADVETPDDELTYEIVTGPGAGTLGGSGGARTYTPAVNANGTDSFTYRVVDAGDGSSAAATSATRTVTLVVRAVNDLPTVAADSAETSYDVPVVVDVLTNDSDVEGLVASTLTITAEPAHGTASVVDGRIRYVPAAGYHGPDSLTYRVCDTDDACATATVTLTVLENNAPVAGADSVSTNEDVTSTAVNVLTNDTDADGDPLTVTGSTNGAFGTVSCTAAGACTYTPAPNFYGEDSFTYTVSDGRGGSVTGTVSAIVTPVQDAPVAAPDSATTDEDTASGAIAVLANDSDADDDTLEITASTNGARGTVSCLLGSCVYTPAPDTHGPDSFTYTVSDGLGGTATATVNVTVVPVDDLPAATDDAATVAEDGTIDVGVLANDRGLGDGGIALTIQTPPSNGTATVVGTAVRYVPTANFHGADSFSYRIEDGDGDATTGIVALTVTSVNDAPVASADTAETLEDKAVTIAMLTNDSDVEGDTLTVTGASDPAHGSVSCTATDCTYAPDADFNGADTFTYTVTDGHGGNATGTVTVQVAAASLVEDVAAGDTVTTGSSATPAEPVQVGITSPVAGPVTVVDRESTTASAGGYQLFGLEVVITAPEATAAAPLRLVFTVDGSKVVPPAASLTAAAADLAVFRNGTLVGACPGATTASPDPCISGVRVVGGDLEVTVLTSRASTWTLGIKNPPPPVTTTTTTPPPATPTTLPTSGGAGDPVRAVNGYWIAATDGSVMAYGGAPRFGGSLAGQRLNHPIVGLEATPSGKGYWLVARDGGIFSFGDAAFHGSTGAIALNKPIVGMASTPSGQGYWLVASDGGIFAFGDAAFHGSTGDIVLNKPIVGMESSPSGRGYWLVATDGGIFTFGDANFHGSTGAMTLNKPIVGMTTSPSGKGYWLVASDGGIFTFGDAVFHGSTGAMVLNKPIIGMSATPSGRGYWLVASDGGLFTFGDAGFHGSAAGVLSTPAVGAAW